MAVTIVAGESRLYPKIAARNIQGNSNLRRLGRRSSHYVTGETRLKRLIVTGLLLTGPAVWAEWPPANYSVEVVYTGPSGVSRIDKFYVAEGKRRIESSPSRGQALTSIERPDKGVTWLVFDARKSCMEMVYKKEKGESHELMDIPTSKGPRVKVGSETKNGVSCVKYKYSAGSNTYFYWLNSRNQAPVHLEDERGVLKLDWKNLKLTAPPKELFEVPAGYTTTKI